MWTKFTEKTLPNFAKMGDRNPWVVRSIEAFNLYCCPECDFKSKDKDYFKKHAMESHNKSKVFFIMSKSENNMNDDDPIAHCLGMSYYVNFWGGLGKEGSRMEHLLSSSQI